MPWEANTAMKIAFFVIKAIFMAVLSQKKQRPSHHREIGGRGGENGDGVSEEAGGVEG